MPTFFWIVIWILIGMGIAFLVEWAIDFWVTWPFEE